MFLRDKNEDCVRVYRSCVVVRWVYPTGTSFIRPFSVLPDVIVLLGVAAVTFGSSDSFLLSSYLLRELLRETYLYSLVMVCSHLTMLILQLLGSVRVFSPLRGEDTDGVHDSIL